jgi:hypothetical protein
MAAAGAAVVGARADLIEKQPGKLFGTCMFTYGDYWVYVRLSTGRKIEGCILSTPLLRETPTEKERVEKKSLISRK